MNTARMLKLAEFMERNPEQVRMDIWAARGLRRDDEICFYDAPRRPEDVQCGTVACIAGWAVMLFGAEDPKGHGWTDAAARLLDLSHSDHGMFTGTGWKTLDVGAAGLHRLTGAQVAAELRFRVSEYKEKRT